MGKDGIYTYKPMEKFPDLPILSVPKELAQMLEESQVAVENCLSSNNLFLQGSAEGRVEQAYVG
jgi:hypothetical protein